MAEVRESDKIRARDGTSDHGEYYDHFLHALERLLEEKGLACALNPSDRCTRIPEASVQFFVSILSDSERILRAPAALARRALGRKHGSVGFFGHAAARIATRRKDELRNDRTERREISYALLPCLPSIHWNISDW